MKVKQFCLHCKAQYYPNNLSICGTCDKNFCPNCGSCKCLNKISHLDTNKIQSLSIKDVDKANEMQTLEISASITPLIGQIPITTKKGLILKTEFELFEGKHKLPLIIWGPVPEKIFATRYEFNEVTISGLKKRVFNGKTVLIASKNAKYHVNTSKMRSLEFFISQTSI
jgi:hypothetical protein